MDRLDSSGEPAGKVGVLHLNDYLRLGDEEFIVAAYRTLLGRAPDQSGNESYLARMRHGAARVDILCDIRYSKEGRCCGVELPGLRFGYLNWLIRRAPLVSRVRSRLARSSPPVSQMGMGFYEGLVAYSDAEFVGAAYFVVLGRPIDSDCKAYALSRLKGGESRAAIVRAFQALPEAQTGLVRESPNSAVWPLGSANPASQVPHPQLAPTSTRPSGIAMSTFDEESGNATESTHARLRSLAMRWRTGVPMHE